jgi:hypothetical protein
VSRTVIEHCIFETCASQAIQILAYPTGNTIRSCVMIQSAGATAGAGIDSSCADQVIESCHVIGDSGQNGFILRGAGARLIGCKSESCANGFDLETGATDAVLIGCRDTGSSPFAFVAQAGATGLTLVGCSWSSPSDSSPSSNQPMQRVNVQAFTSNLVTFPAVTPVFTLSTTTAYVVDCQGNYTVGAQALTINAPTNSSHIPEGGLVQFVITKIGANALNLTWNAVYVGPSGSAFAGMASVASNTTQTVIFRKVSTSYRALSVGAQVAI